MIQGYESGFGQTVSIFWMINPSLVIAYIYINIYLGKATHVYIIYIYICMRKNSLNKKTYQKVCPICNY